MAYETHQLVEFGMSTYKSALPYRVKSKLQELVIDQIGIEIGCAKSLPNSIQYHMLVI